MSKKASIIAVIILIALAVLIGWVLVNKGDGPVNAIVISDKAVENPDEYISQLKGSTPGDKSSQNVGTYLVLTEEFNKFKESFKADIPAKKDLYANIQLVESPKGSKYIAKWLRDGTTVKEEEKELVTDKKGTVSFLLEGDIVSPGNYTLELTSSGNKLFEYGLVVK